MGLFSSKPRIDPTGQERHRFKLEGSRAALKFFRYQDVDSSSHELLRYGEKVVEEFGEFQPDIGRVSLLLAIFSSILKDDKTALDLAEQSRKILTPLGRNSFDYRAAYDLSKKLAGKFDGSWKQSHANPLIDDSSPIGHFLNDLKP